MSAPPASPATAGGPEQPPAPVPFGRALRFWFKLGLISFGGPAGQISIMHAELVERQRWISEKRFLHALNYCMLLPGPEAQQLATYLGWLMHGARGGIWAGVLFVLPSLLILTLLSWLYMAHGQNAVLVGLFYGIKPAVTALVLQAAVRMGSRVLKNAVMWSLAAASFVAIFALQLPFPAIVLAAGLLGYGGARIAPQYFSTSHAAAAAARRYGAALIDDDTAPPAHARFSRTRLAAVLGAGALLWLVPMAVLWAIQEASLGATATLTQMAWFFTKAALLTFGGAYAVLPYVYQGAVVHYGWLTPTQMIDGLALGETTPGPLIMVVAFVAFAGAWQSAELMALFGPDRLFLAAALAAALVTWFTFLPSFVFILAGGPLVEATHDRLAFTGPLTAITAAVVGVILNLALFFAWHVLWPRGWQGGFDTASAVIGVAAAVALLRYQRGVIEVIAACAAAGLAVHLLR